MERLRSKDYLDYCATHPSPHEIKRYDGIGSPATVGQSLELVLTGKEESFQKFHDILRASLVTSNGCIEWAGARGNGYGAITHDGKQIPAHRYAYAVKHGRVPGGMEVHHECQNRRCVNVDHLQCLTPDRHRAKHWSS